MAKNVTLSIIIPVYNEKKFFKKLLDKVKKVNLGKVKKEIIVVDDFSTDGTRDLLKRLKDCKVFFHEKNKGKGAAVRTGLKHATGDIVVIQDADLEYDPRDIAQLLEVMLRKNLKVVYGSRFKKKTFEKRTWSIPVHYLGNRLLSLATTLLYGQWVSDMETCYKMFRKSVLKTLKLKASRFDIEPEITAKTLKKGIRIYEVPISYNPRKWREGKKINWKDGVKALWYLLKLRVKD